MPTVSSTFDMWVGTTTVQTSFDMLLSKTTTLATSFDMVVGGLLITTFDMLIVDERGTFRGTGTLEDRDALEALQPGDVFIVTDPE